MKPLNRKQIEDVHLWLKQQLVDIDVNIPFTFKREYMKELNSYLIMKYKKKLKKLKRLD